jgi:hypothetical protein
MLRRAHLPNQSVDRGLESLFCGLAQFSVMSYIHSGDDRPKHDSPGTVR